jgi:hypothetical protein
MEEQDARQAHYEMLRSWGWSPVDAAGSAYAHGTWAEPRTEAQQEVEAG